MAKQAANDSIKTVLNGNWPGIIMEEKPKRKNAPEKPADLSVIKRTKAPYMHPRVDRFKSKYDGLFTGAVEGDCWETTEEDVGKIEKALKTWMEKNGIEGMVRRNKRCPDGVARVWLWKVHQKRKTA